jgi:hypothetical protein
LEVESLEGNFEDPFVRFAFGVAGVDVFVRDAWLREGLSVGFGVSEGEGEGVRGGMRSWSCEGWSGENGESE